MTRGLFGLYRFVTSTSRSDAADLRAWMLATITYQTVHVMMGTLTTILSALAAMIVTDRLWPLAWLAADLALTSFRLRTIRRINSGEASPAERERDYALVLLASLVWAALFGLGEGAMVATGIPALMILAGMNVAGTLSVVASRNAAIPRYGLLCLLTCGVPFVPGVAMALQPDMSLVALFAAILILGLCAMLMQNSRLLVRKFYDEKTLKDIARSDPLTGLPNRKGLEEELTLLSSHPGEAPGPVLTVLCLDLDGFKGVNDAHGHPCGDRLLEVVAARLRAVMRQGDGAFRIGGDEFVCTLPGASAEDAETVAARLIDSVSQPMEIGISERVRVGVSIGGATGRIGEGDAAQLLSEADRALYQAKKSGKNRYCQSDPVAFGASRSPAAGLMPA